METCHTCKRKFPKHLIHYVKCSIGEWKSCPICAFKNILSFHVGDYRKKWSKKHDILLKEAEEYIKKGY